MPILRFYSYRSSIRGIRENFRPTRGDAVIDCKQKSKQMWKICSHKQRSTEAKTMGHEKMQ